VISQKKDSGLERLEFLIGGWSGEGEGFGQKSDVKQTYQYILQDRFIHSRTKSVTRSQDGTVLDDHEDWGVFSFDPDRDFIVLREFYSEGYVNIYTMDEVGSGEKILIFSSEKTEGAGGLMARVRIKIISEFEYEMFLDLAKPGNEFRQCQVIRMKRDS
jgi:hypothetical protein